MAKKKKKVENLIWEVVGGNVMPEPSDIDMDQTPNVEDCLPFDPFKQDKLWIQSAVGEEGRVEEYLEEVYGPKAFNKNGTIKISYINKAIKRIKARHPDGVPKGSNDYELMMALILAKRLKKM